METKNTISTVIVLVIGVILIAGVVTPVISSLSDDSGTTVEPSGPAYTNTIGVPMISLSKLAEIYDLNEVDNYGITNIYYGETEMGTHTDKLYQYVNSYDGVNEPTYEESEVTLLSDYIYDIPLFISDKAIVYYSQDLYRDPAIKSMDIRWIVPDDITVWTDSTDITDPSADFDMNVIENKVWLKGDAMNEYVTFEFSELDLDNTFIYYPDGDWKVIGKSFDENSDPIPHTLKWTGTDMYTISALDMDNNWIYCRPNPASYSDTFHSLVGVVEEFTYQILDKETYQPTEFTEVDGVYQIEIVQDMPIDIEMYYNVDGSGYYAEITWCLAPASGGGGGSGGGGSDSGGSGLSDTTVALLTVIPLIMLTGLILITVKAFKRG